jgi:uncharacterized membrane protein
MLQPLTFISHLPLSEGVQSLHKLAAQKDFYRTVGRSNIHIKIDSIEFDKYDSKTVFWLYSHCGLHTKFPIYVYFKLEGELQDASNIIPVQVQLQLHTQISTFWRFLVFWIIVIAFSLLGIMSRISTSTPIENLSVLIVAVCGAGLGYVWYLYRAYKLGMSGIPSLVYQALVDDPTKSYNKQDLPEWVSDLSKTS